MPKQLRAGDYIGGEYRILKVFGGEGASGMGVVYLVENRSFYKPFVLKTYQSGELGDKKPRFLKEAHAWVHLGSHSNIVRCLWVSEISGDLYIAADYVAPDEEGINTLEQRLAQGRIPLEKQLRWAAEFCFGMRYAYRKGMLSHRDLKPSNLMLDDGQLKITDFGLTKFEGQLDPRVAEGGPVSPAITIQGAVLGTPPYMSPEQFLDSAGVDHRADIYSFGVILYALATGELPIYPDRNPKDENEVTLLWAIAHHRGTVRRANFPHFPIVERCLQKDPAKRFQSFDEVLAAITKVAASNKVPMPKELIANSEFDDAYALAMSLVALGKPDEAVEKLGKITTCWPNMPAPFTEMGKILMERGQTVESIPWFKRAVEIDENRSAPWNNLGNAHALLGQLEAAEQAYTAAIHVDSENTGAMVGLAQILTDENPELAWKWCERAYELRPKKVNVLKVAGIVAMRAGKTEAASIIHQQLYKIDPENKVALFNLALTYAQRRMLKDFRDVAFLYLEQRPEDYKACKIFCQAFADLGDIDEAKNICLLWRKIPGAEVGGTINLARLLASQGSHLQAYHWLNIALEKWPRHPGLWLTQAIVLRALPQYRTHALTAAENAAICVSERIDQPPRVTMADIEPVIRSLR